MKALVIHYALALNQMQFEILFNVLMIKCSKNKHDCWIETMIFLLNALRVGVIDFNRPCKEQQRRTAI